MTILKIIFGFFISFFFFHFALADTPPDIECADFLPGCDNGSAPSDPRDHTFFKDTLPNILDWLMSLGAAGGVLMGVVAGTMYLFGGANEELRSRAHKTAIFAVLGIVLAMFAFFIVEIINRLPYPT